MPQKFLDFLLALIAVVLTVMSVFAFSFLFPYSS